MSHAAIVNGWFGEQLANGALAQSTEAYNQVVHALPALIAQLDGNPVELAAEPIPTPELAPPSKKGAPAE